MAEASRSPPHSKRRHSDSLLYSCYGWELHQGQLCWIVPQRGPWGQFCACFHGLSSILSFSTLFSTFKGIYLLFLRTGAIYIGVANLTFKWLVLYRTIRYNAVWYLNVRYCQFKIKQKCNLAKPNQWEQFWESSLDRPCFLETVSVTYRYPFKDNASPMNIFYVTLCCYFFSSNVPVIEPKVFNLPSCCGIHIYYY